MYKRQVIDPELLRLLPQRLRDRSRVPGFVLPGAAAAALCPAASPAAVGPGPVSSTHLAVYKRQTLSHLLFTEQI